MKKTLNLSLIMSFLFVIGAIGISRFMSTATAQQELSPDTADVKPRSRHRINPHGADSQPTGSTGVITPQITYHGGHLISTPTIYYIWYGNWNQNNKSDNPAGQQILRDFANNIGGSPYFKINTTYSITNQTITGAATFGGETSDAYSRGTRLRDNDVLTIVNRAISTGKLPFNPSGVYFVLTSSDVAETSGFCSQYCGWHTSAIVSAGDVRFAFIGNANRCLNACAAQTNGPNGNAGVDAMASIIAHELSESTTDPDPDSGWVDRNGAENADKCAWTFGQNQYVTADGAWANVHLGSRDYLIQRNLKQATSGDTCNMSLTTQ